MALGASLSYYPIAVKGRRDHGNLKRKDLIACLFTISDGESMAIVIGNIAADRRHGPGAVTES